MNSVAKEPINIVMAADNNYRHQLLVAVKSAAENKKPETVYSFKILIPNDFDVQTKETLNRILDDHKIDHAEFIDMEKDYDDRMIHIAHTSISTYYRLSLPELLKEDKCIYLDTDTVINGDLSTFYDLLPSDILIAGVKAAGYYWPPESLDPKAKALDIKTFDSYVNAGVLLMNLKLMREMNISDKIREMLKKEWESQDQDIINSVCYGYIEILPPKYNSMTKYNNDDIGSFDSPVFPYLKNCYSKTEWEEACTNPLIIHYADREKPWNSLTVPFSALWWKYLVHVDRYIPCFDECMDLLADQEKAKTLSDLRISDISERLNSVENSLSFKIGRFLTLPFRKIRDFILR